LKNEDLLKDLETYKQAYQREKKIRLESERLLENNSRELYVSNQELNKQYQQSEQRAAELEFFLSLARVAQQKLTLKKTLQFYVEAICKLTRWPVGHVYAPKNTDNYVLTSLNIWQLDDKDAYKSLYNTSTKMNFKIDEVLPGRILRTGEVLFIEDVANAPLYMRAKVCQKLKLRSTLGIPIKCYGKVVAIAEFFMPETYCQDQQMHNLVFSFTQQLETILERLKSEEEARENYIKLQRALAEVQKLAYYDPVTGLANRRQFEISLKQEIARAKRYHYTFALLYLDLDYFKSINDTFGHDIGDLLLQEVASRLQTNVRAGDIVARLGGDEFAIILGQLKTAKNAGAIAAQLLKSLRKPCKLAHHDVSVSFSIGIACYPEAGQDPVLLCKSADLALYQAKGAGRNRYQCFSHSNVSA
jgi:diguanylate cyclase (GGDEF)-like protein